MRPARWWRIACLCHQRLGRHVLLIGHAGHPEVIGTMGQLPEGCVTLIETEAEEVSRAFAHQYVASYNPGQAILPGRRGGTGPR